MRLARYQILPVIVFSYLFYLGLCSYFTFRPDWDFLSYHLPHALQLFKLTTFKNGPFLAAVNAGMPPLAHWAQGLLIYVTGRFSAANFINFLALVALLVYGWKRLNFQKERLLLFIMLTLSIPLVHIHVTSGYIDFWSNAALAIAALETLFLYTQSSIKISPKPTLFAISMFVAFISKFQMWPLCVILSFFYWLRYCTNSNFSLFKKTALSFTLICIIGSWPLRNLLVFNNPMYPLAIPGLTKIFPNYTLDTGRIEGQMPQNLRNVPQPLRFVVSAFELSRISSGNSMPWNLDQYAEGGEKNAHHRLGGWGLITMVILSALVWPFLRRERAVGLVFISLVGLTSLTPQSHELRYWLYIPLVLASLSTLSFFDIKSKRARTILFSLILFNFILVTSKVRPTLSFAPVTTYAPEEAKTFWEKALAKEEYRLCKLPNTIFFSGPSFNDFIVTDCH